MSLVIDSSITLAWFFENERSATADAVLRQDAALEYFSIKREIFSATGVQIISPARRLRG